MYSQGSRKLIALRPAGKKHHQLSDFDPVLARILLSRGVYQPEQLARSLQNLPSPWLFSGMQGMVALLATALNRQQRIMIVADFDADGATSCAVAVRGLRLLGAQQVDFLVPDRFKHGYGLTPTIVELASAQRAEVILTVDNGISSVEGVAVAKALGMTVLITDHHAVGLQLPAADALVNPQLPDCSFPSQHLAGVGVMFYVLMALRSHLREQHWFDRQGIPEPNLGQLLDYVALGTVADVVTLDQANRILVHQGLLRIRSGRCHVGIKALIEIAGKQTANLQAGDLGFYVAPRLNAAGRMDDMAKGIRCLLTDDEATARHLSQQLDEFNNERKAVESQMKSQAMLLLADMKYLEKKAQAAGVCLFNDEWHPGVVGILAARIKDRLHRPVIAFAPTLNDEIRGSGRSIQGLHIRDVLSDIAAAHPKLISHFGGHAMAAGLSIKRHDLPHFALAFAETVAKKLDAQDLQQRIDSDGELDDAHLTLEFAQMLREVATWGHGFPEPVFSGVFDVIQCRVVGNQHLKFVLRPPFSDKLLDAISFFVDRPENWLGCRKIQCAYQLTINEFRGQRDLQLVLVYFERWDAV